MSLACSAGRRRGETDTHGSNLRQGLGVGFWGWVAAAQRGGWVEEGPCVAAAEAPLEEEHERALLRGPERPARHRVHLVKRKPGLERRVGQTASCC